MKRFEGQETIADVIQHTAEQNAVDILLHAIDLECISVLKELLDVPTFLVSSLLSPRPSI